MGNSKPTAPDERVTYPAVRLVMAGANKTISCLPGLKSRTIPAFQRLLHDTDKNMLFDSHDHLPKPFGWEPFGPSPG
jgi:hypothetical protein